MQANNSPRFLKNFMVGLVASSAGAFIALPGAAMPEPAETGAEIGATEEIVEPTATETLPEPGAEALEVVPAADVDLVEEDMFAEEEVTDEDVASDEMVTEEPIADEMEAMEGPVAEDAEVMEEPVADDMEAVEEPVAEDAEALEEAPIAEDAEALEEEPVAEDAEALEEEPVADEMEAVEEPVAEDAEVMEEPVADDMEAVEEPVAEDAEALEEEPVAEDAEALEEPVAEDEVTDEAPVAAEEMDTAAFTIAELTDNSESFEILAAALAAADLTEILGSEGPFTVFAPTDDAFAALPEGSVDQLLLPENKDVLVQVLTYHVVPGAILSTDLEDGAVATVEGSEVEIAIADTVTVNNANVVAADIEASNGVIHVIDRVIIPPSPEAGADADVEADETASSVAE